MPTATFPHTKGVCRVAAVDGNYVQKRIVLARHKADGFAVELEPGAVYLVEELLGDGRQFLLATEDGTKAVAWEEVPGLVSKGV